LAGLGLGISATAGGRMLLKRNVDNGYRVGIIGLDVSHSVSFTKLLNASVPDPAFGGYKVVAAYPKGSNDIEISVSRIPEFTSQVKAMGVEIVASIQQLLDRVDVVLLNTNDGRLHPDQALAVFKSGKKIFINKPFAASLSDVVAIFNKADKYKVPVFSSSSMRYMENLKEIQSDKTGKILGADVFSPATLEKTHPDLFWYGIHGVEMLYTVMGRGCKTVSRVSTDNTDVVTGIWEDGRIATFRGTRTGKHEYGGIVFGEKANVIISPAKGLKSLLVEITQFFQSGKPPVCAEETLEIYAFMESADESKRKGGAAVKISDVLRKAGRK
jgi:predicted dehydrogenase